MFHLVAIYGGFNNIIGFRLIIPWGNEPQPPARHPNPRSLRRARITNWSFLRRKQPASRANCRAAVNSPSDNEEPPLGAFLYFSSKELMDRPSDRLKKLAHPRTPLPSNKRKFARTLQIIHKVLLQLCHKRVVRADQIGLIIEE